MQRSKLKVKPDRPMIPRRKDGFRMRACTVWALSVPLLITGTALPALSEPAKSKSSSTIPKPGVASAAEAAYIARLDNAIAPASGYPVTSEDAALVKNAIKAIGAKNLVKGEELKAKVKDPIARKLIYWYNLRSGNGEPKAYRDFLNANPAWPNRALLTRRMEEAVFKEGGTAASIHAFFKDRPPETGAGKAALASALLAQGNEAEAKRLAALAWRENAIPTRLESGFLKRFGKLLTAADHKWRLDQLIIDSPRWSGQRKSRAAVAKRLIPLLPAAEQKKARARLAVFQLSKSSRRKIEALPAESDPDWGVVFHRIQALRRSKKTSESTKLLLGAPLEEAKIVVPDAWWTERRAHAYIALKANKYKLAYDLVAEAGPLTVNPLKDQQFTAGWIALRYLKKPDLAEPHFVAFKKAADGPLSRSKSNYWMGRLAEAKGKKDEAKKHYEAATQDLDTFHGLLSLQKLRPGNQPIPLKPPAEPDAALIDRFNSLDAIKAAVIARKSSLSPYIVRSFIDHFRREVFETEAGFALVAHFAEALGDTQMAVRTGKTAIARRHNLINYAYPVHPFPAYTPLRKPPETALLLGIARQETEFNSLIVSGAGAKGLLQVMTITAKHVCRDYKIKCHIKKLLSDPSYNAKIASAYIGDRMKEFRGSYVLTFAGYNAGPGRARQWIREFGDPRNPKIDPIDWIERIPFEETRKYVAKVLSNLQIYRARLGEENPLRLDKDLNRARTGRAVKATSSTQ